ncbi:hypothetical protein R1sor_017462 [Riccia sorocarpa]|uniref:BTB domain-containing protein n=1 Tax=Riccia sorocarpa TaxID=122646 RepID=A0ABD3IAM9_9MARC
MECPSCKDLMWCEQRIEDLLAVIVSKAPLCQKCGVPYKKSSNLNVLDTEPNTLALIVRAAVTKVDSTRERAKYNELSSFMQVLSTDVSFSGDVVRFVVRGCGMIEAHRSILTPKSSMFHQMFDRGMLEGNTGVILTDGATYPAMKAVINYCYTKEISFTDEVPHEDVLRVAHTYRIIRLVDICVSELCVKMNVKNTLEMLRLSKRYNSRLLQEATAEYFKANFDAVFLTLLEIV